MSGATDAVVGGQFFMHYDTSRLQFVNATTGSAPFTVPVFSDVDTVSGLIDFAVGVPGGGPGTSSASTMAVLTFNWIGARSRDGAEPGRVPLTHSNDKADEQCRRSHLPDGNANAIHHGRQHSPSHHLPGKHHHQRGCGSVLILAARARVANLRQGHAPRFGRGTPFGCVVCDGVERRRL